MTGFVITSLIALATIVSTCSNDGGGGGGASGGGLFLHTFGCAYFKFFNSIVLPHNLHVPVFATGSSAVCTFRESLELISSLTSSFAMSSSTSSNITTGISGLSDSGIGSVLTITSLGISAITFSVFTTI